MRNYRANRMAFTTGTAYSSVMEAIIFVIGLAVLGAAVQRWGADSRPGVGDTRTDRGERWFIN